MNNLDKKVGKLLVVGFSGKTVPDHIRELIHNYHIGGIILFGRNIGTPEEILTLTTDLQSEAKKAGYEYPLMICVDQENGVVRRLGEGATIFPGAMTLGATDNPENAYKIGVATGKELLALGINWNLAPVLDVNNNPDNPVIGVRSFGESPEKVAEFGKEMMRGMQDAGVITTLKHFPGHGDTNVDSHLDLPVISHTKERLDNIELLPFKKNIEAGADTVMSAHVYFPSIESQSGIPATLSSKVITGLLREELGFNGVVTTDCMEMNAIANGVGTEQGGVEAVKAGVDFVMISHTPEKQKGTHKAIVEAVHSGHIPEAMIEQANQRIDTLKQKYFDWNTIPLTDELTVPDTVGSYEHKELAYQVYKQSVTIVKNDGLLPISLTEQQRILVLCPDNGTTMQVEDKRYANLSLDEAVKEYHKKIDVRFIDNKITNGEINEILGQIKDYDFVIIGTVTLTKDNKQISLIERIGELEVPYAVIAMRSPYDFSFIPNVPVYINTYEFTYPALRAAVGAIFGKERVTGKSPVTITSLEKE
ncbi:beta-N-acetylhexosaminidase [Ornithinibacillus halophilus]|uniref:Beta-N-acetylhexosaminidase n=1 Tax=Ornithinibacillus halophilus TaxID=930117 RepID=A0A1M5K2T9_9BACI|nr:beta-N-acetylhexosaminidase [Ornithinibacillus halophilus]SHG47087.1 beta-N-acetylhexosaminidase [Ornithinibacillus halophilus]